MGTHIVNDGSPYSAECIVKTTIEIADELLHRARQQIRRQGGTLRALVEEGLRLALRASDAPPTSIELPVSKSKPGFSAEFAEESWSKIKDEARHR